MSSFPLMVAGAFELKGVLGGASGDGIFVTSLELAGVDFATLGTFVGVSIRSS